MTHSKSPISPNAPRDAATDAKRKMENIFDQSLAVLCSGDVPSTTSSSSTTKRSNVRRTAKAAESYTNSLPIHIDKISLQRRALVDAAKALATLWKVPETRGSRLQNRGLEFSRGTS
jgi:hypothetical protein